MPLNLTAAPSSQVTSALQRAGAKTGADFDFLMKMAQRESSLNPNAKAKTSSAAGLFQFIEQTWLGAVKQYGARHGLEGFASDISRGSNGKFTVANEARREEILDLRFNPNASAALAGELANNNQSYLENRLGRAAKAADLYAAHFLGPAGAVKLLSAASTMNAAELLPQAAAANKPVFYDGARAKTVGEVVASIAASMGATSTNGAPDGKSQKAVGDVARSDAVMAKTIAPLETRQADTAQMGIAQAGFAKMAYGNVRDLTPPPIRDVSVVSIKTAPEIQSSTASRLLKLATDALQFLDPTRLSKERDADRF
jgi:Transglycosylase SLT domain